MSDGSQLPPWLSYDATSNTFSAREVPKGITAVEVKIQALVNGRVVEESPSITIGQ
jgi:hypothetical protein